VSLAVLNTDVASASFRDRLPERRQARLAGQTLCISCVTLGELTKWATLRSWGPRRLGELAEWRQHVAVLAYDEAVAIKWGQLQARAQQRGRPRPVNDTWIAACCLADELPLATLNAKDFADFATYEGLVIL
jgi:toxin FitB